MMRFIYVIHTLFLVALLSQPICAQATSQHGQSQPTRIEVYGNTFTIDPSYIDRMTGGDPNYAWKDVAYFIPQILPTMRDGKDIRSIAETAKTITIMERAYQGLAQEQIQALALRLETDGHFGILEANTQDPTTLNQLRTLYPFASEQARIDKIVLELDDWIRRDVWREKLAKYNATRTDDKKIEAYIFTAARQMYQYYTALRYLNMVLRRSPEFVKFKADYIAENKILPPKSPAQ